MGFRFNPALQPTPDSYLYAGVLTGTRPANFATMEYTDNSVAGGTVTITYDANPAANPTGPSVSFYNPNAAITFIKVAFVHSRFDWQLTNAGGGNVYPTDSTMIYSSSYVFTSVSTFNSPVAIIQGSFNNLYYHLPDTRYAIYGITNFNLPQGSGCTTIKLNVTLDSIDAYTVTTPNANPAEIFFTADIFTKNID